MIVNGPNQIIMKLKNRNAIITGASRGIGKNIAKILASEGAYVNLLSRTKKQLIDVKVDIVKKGGLASVYSVDITDERGIVNTVKTIIDNVGPVDILINNAGIDGPLGPVWEIDSNEWWDCLNVNLRGAFLCIQAVLPLMISKKKGRIINMASISCSRVERLSSIYHIDIPNTCIT